MVHIQWHIRVLINVVGSQVYKLRYKLIQTNKQKVSVIFVLEMHWFCEICGSNLVKVEWLHINCECCVCHPTGSEVDWEDILSNKLQEAIISFLSNIMR